MKIELLEHDKYKIFINDAYLGKINIKDNAELGKYIKELVLKLKNIYNIVLTGFYNVDVYIVKNFGIIIEIENVDNYISKTIDLRIILHSNEDIYLKIKNDEMISKYREIKYLEQYYYLNVNDVLKKDVNAFVEDYTIVYGADLKRLKNNWHSLT